MKEQKIRQAYELAVERYAAIGIDVEKVMEQLQGIQLSLHCWQADDVTGFESTGELTGGIQATGNYPGKARNIDELRADISKVLCQGLIVKCGGHRSRSVKQFQVFKPYPLLTFCYTRLVACNSLLPATKRVDNG